MTKLSLVSGILITVGASLAVQAQTAPAASGLTAKATIKDAQGKTLGEATLRDASGGVLITVDLTGVPPGVHAFHIHTTGLCEAPQFTTAGGHFAPGGTKHGLMAAGGPHAGDMPNIHVPADGKLSFEVLDTHATLAAGPASIFDADGAALVLHATGDDYVTDPAGNAGGRIACGVITK